MSLSKRGISEEIRQLYESGHSLLAISEQLNVSRWKVRTILERGNVALRSQMVGVTGHEKRLVDHSVKVAPYGQCLVNGKLVDDPKEQALIQRIQKYQRLGLSHRAIARKLNCQKYKPRRAKFWSQTLVSTIIKRLSRTERK